jgi:hypothetical protein
LGTAISKEGQRDWLAWIKPSSPDAAAEQEEGRGRAIPQGRADAGHELLGEQVVVNVQPVVFLCERVEL